MQTKALFPSSSDLRALQKMVACESGLESLGWGKKKGDVEVSDGTNVEHIPAKKEGVRYPGQPFRLASSRNGNQSS